MPPDPELVDLIEWAFLGGQIDGLAAELAYLFAWKKRADLRKLGRPSPLLSEKICGIFCGTG